MKVSEQQVRRTFALTPLASLQPCSAKQEKEFSARTLLWLPLRGPECAVTTAWPCPGQQAQPWGPGGTGGSWCNPRGGTCPAGLSLLVPSHFGVHPSRWDGAARAEPGNQMQIWLGEDPCTTGASVVGRFFPP